MHMLVDYLTLNKMNNTKYHSIGTVPRSI